MTAVTLTDAISANPSFHINMYQYLYEFTNCILMYSDIREPKSEQIRDSQNC